MSKGRSNVWKLRDIADAKDPAFGAVADGVTLDTTALNSAIVAGAAADVAVYLSGGTYFTETLNGASGMTLRGNGATVKFKDDGTAASRTLYLNAVDDIDVGGLTFTSDATARTAVYGLIRAEGCARVKIHGNKFLVSPSTAVYFANCTDSVIDGNIVGDGTSSTFADGIHVNRQSSRVTVTNNILRGTGDDAIAIVSNKDVATYTQNTDILVSNNQIYQSAGGGITVQGGDRVTVSANIIRGSTNNGILADFTPTATYNGGADCVISANNINGAGISCIRVGQLDGGTVTGNIGIGATNEGIELVNQSKNVTVVGNRCKGNGDYGLYEEAGSGPNVFVANVLTGNTTGGKLINGGTGSTDADNLV